MRTEWHANDGQTVKNHRTENKSYAGFYMFMAGLVAVGGGLIAFFVGR